MKHTITFNADNKTVATIKKMIALKKEYREIIESKVKITKE